MRKTCISMSCLVTYSATYFPVKPIPSASCFRTGVVLKTGSVFVDSVDKCWKTSDNCYIKGYPQTYSLKVYPVFSSCLYLHLHVHPGRSQ